MAARGGQAQESGTNIERRLGQGAMSPELRGFRFALSVNRMLDSLDDWRQTVAEAESRGYSALVLGDHLGAERYAAVPALAYAAAQTSRLRLGSFLFNNDFRHPAVLAKEVATLDIMTGGRFEFGIGAGWMRGDYEMTGIRKDPGPIRAERLEEALVVLKGLFAPGPLTFEGRHYRISALEGLPKPAQSPHPPIVVGGGSREVLAVAARQADVASLNPVHRRGVPGAGPELSWSALAERVAWVAEFSSGRPQPPDLHLLIHGMAIEAAPGPGAARVASDNRLSPEEALASPYLLIGSAGEAARRLEGIRSRLGIAYFSVRAADAEQFQPVLEALTPPPA